MAKSNLWNPGMLPSHVHVCVFVPMPQLHLGSPLTPFLPPPPHPTFRPSQVPSWGHSHGKHPTVQTEPQGAILHYVCNSLNHSFG